jgi:hypothetical protein
MFELNTNKPKYAGADGIARFAYERLLSMTRGSTRLGEKSFCMFDRGISSKAMEVAHRATRRMINQVGGELVATGFYPPIEIRKPGQDYTVTWVYHGASLDEYLKAAKKARRAAKKLFNK